jgi:hypothetical protein
MIAGNSKTREDVNEVKIQINEYKQKFKELNKENQVLMEARDSYFTVIKDNAKLKTKIKQYQNLHHNSQSIL